MRGTKPRFGAKSTNLMKVGPMRASHTLRSNSSRFGSFVGSLGVGGESYRSLFDTGWVEINS